MIFFSNLNGNGVDLWTLSNVKLSDPILNLYFYADSVEHPSYVTRKPRVARLTIRKRHHYPDRKPSHAVRRRSNYPNTYCIRSPQMS